MNIVDSGRYKSAIYPIISCEIVLTGKTNSRNEPATIHAISFAGHPEACKVLGQESLREEAKMSWPATNPTNPVIRDMRLVLEYADCRGDLKMQWDLSDRLQINDQYLGTCKINGSLKIISTPAIEAGLN